MRQCVTVRRVKIGGQCKPELRVRAGVSPHWLVIREEAIELLLCKPPVTAVPLPEQPTAVGVPVNSYWREPQILGRFFHSVVPRL